MSIRKPLSGKVARTSSRLWHQADTLSAQGKGLSGIGGIAIADVERLEICKRLLAYDTASVRAAVQRPIVKDREMAVTGRMNIELNDIRARVESRAHRGQRILDEIVPWSIDHRRRAGLLCQSLGTIRLMHAAMREENRPAGCCRSKPTRVQEVEAGDEKKKGKGNAGNKAKSHMTFPIPARCDVLR